MGTQTEDGSPLRRWLATVLAGEPITRTSPLAGGFRNDNLLVTTAAGQRFVLRRYRHGGHRCEVEVALAARLAGAVPVPEVVAADATGAHAGEPVLLSRFAPGRLIADALPTLPAEEAGQLGEAVGRTLQRVGTVTFDAPGFFAGADLSVTAMGDGFGLPEFVEDCLSRRHPDHRLSAVQDAAVRALARRSTPLIDEVGDARQLVHADFNPKNMLAVHTGAGWSVSALLDWEFAFSGSPLVDVGNLLRFAEDHPPGFTDGFVTGFAANGGRLPPRWRDISQALDLYSLVEMLTGPANDVSRRARALLLERSRSLMR